MGAGASTHTDFSDELTKPLDTKDLIDEESCRCVAGTAAAAAAAAAAAPLPLRVASWHRRPPGMRPPNPRRVS